MALFLSGCSPSVVGFKNNGADWWYVKKEPHHNTSAATIKYLVDFSVRLTEGNRTCDVSRVLDGWTFLFVDDAFRATQRAGRIVNLPKCNIYGGITDPNKKLTWITWRDDIDKTSLRHEIAHLVLGRCFGEWHEKYLIKLGIGTGKE